jgi:SAM-dependent methyltransferase
VRRVSAYGSRVLVAGAGASALVTALAADGDRELIAADISSAALDQLQNQLNALAGSTSTVQMIVGDICDIGDVGNLKPVDVWHDRAVFHFLNDPADRGRYAAAARSTVRPAGHLVIATFSPSGPEECSGLPVTRHSVELIESFEREHLTPWGSAQAFTHAVLRRRD